MLVEFIIIFIYFVEQLRIKQQTILLIKSIFL